APTSRARPLARVRCSLPAHAGYALPSHADEPPAHAGCGLPVRADCSPPAHAGRELPPRADCDDASALRRPLPTACSRAVRRVRSAELAFDRCGGHAPPAAVAALDEDSWLAGRARAPYRWRRGVPAA